MKNEICATSARPTLLLVDDAVTNIDILIETLSQDYSIRVATSGADALVSATEDNPAMILLDVMMPGMDGFEVCRRLKDNPATQDIVVIFITALNEDMDMARGLALGAVDYISKPFNPDIVKARVRNHLDLKLHRDHLTTMVTQRTLELAKAYERLSEMNQLKDNYLRMLSHELRTPANGMLGIGELILELCPPSSEGLEYSDLFRKSSARLSQLIEDATLIVDIKNLPHYEGAPVVFSQILDEVKATLSEISLSSEGLAVPDLFYLKGNSTLLARALGTMVRLALCFSRDPSSVRISCEEEEKGMRVRIVLDALSLSAEQVLDFFAFESPVRSSSSAETLGLSPVVAHKCLSVFGGDLRLIKGGSSSDYLEAIFSRDATILVCGTSCAG